MNRRSAGEQARRSYRTRAGPEPVDTRRLGAYRKHWDDGSGALGVGKIAVNVYRSGPVRADRTEPLPLRFREQQPSR